MTDAAEGIVAATQHYEDVEPVNLGTGEEVAIKDLAELIAKLVGFDGELRLDPSRPGGQPRRRVDVSRAKEKFGFEASVGLEDGLRETIDWYVAHTNEAESASF